MLGFCFLGSSLLSTHTTQVSVSLGRLQFTEHLLCIDSCAKYVLYFFSNEETKHSVYFLLRGRLFISVTEMRTRRDPKTKAPIQACTARATELGFELGTSSVLGLSVLWIPCCTAWDLWTKECPLPSLHFLLPRQMTYVWKRAWNIYVSIKVIISYKYSYKYSYISHLGKEIEHSQCLKGPCVSLPEAPSIWAL